MATGREIMARWDEIEARKRGIARARTETANDNAPREPDGYIEIDGERMAYWLPLDAPHPENDAPHVEPRSASH